MTLATGWTALLAAVLMNFAPILCAQGSARTLQAADRVFRDGRFDEAEKAYSAVVKSDATSYPAVIKLADIALLANRLDRAIEFANRALGLKKNDVDAKIILAEAFYRQDKFAEAGGVIGSPDVEAAAVKQSYSTLNVAKLKSFAGQIAYEVEGAGEITRLKFMKAFPLPLIAVRVNGGKEATFFLDTGGSELLLDSEFAKEIGVKPMGSSTGNFAGGQTAPVGNGRVDSITLGAWTINNVPVGMLPLRPMSAGFEVKALDGCIGTNVLYHFLATIDYPAGELVLRRKTAANLKAFNNSSKSAALKAKQPVVVPMWMAGDHFIVARGRVQALPPALFFVDSGLAGAGLNLAESTIKAAGIVLDKTNAQAGQGGGGHLLTVPYFVERFSLGAVVQSHVSALYDGSFPWEDRWGFHTDGMIGDGFLKSYAVTLDFTGMRLVFQD